VSKIGIFAISPLDSDCLLERSCKDLKDIDLHILYNNKTIGLPEYYNSVITNKENSIYDIIILCHHDISLEYCNLQTLKTALKRFDIVGIAGGLNPTIKEKNLWHWMISKEYYRGFAAHPVSEESMAITTFGPSPARVAVLDGVFLALDNRKIRGTRARFDEQFMWHHYDIDFSLTCNANRLKLGVWPILIYHQSPGLRDLNDKEWNKSNEAFIRKWNNEPI